MKAFLNLKTAAKLMLAFAVVCAMTAFVGYVGVSRLATVDDLLGSMYERDLKGLSDLKDANIQLVTVGRETRRAVSMADPAEIQRMAAAVDQASSDFNTNFASAEKTLITAEGKALASEIRISFPQYVAGCKACIQAALDRKADQIPGLLKSAKSHADTTDAALKKLCAAKEKVAEEAHAAGNATYESARTLLITVVIAAMIVAMLLGYTIAQIVVRPLARAVRVLDAVAEGDMTARLEVDTTDEVGQMGSALNRAVDGIRQALVEVQGVATNVASASLELSSASQQLASGAQEQASSLEETAASLEEITSTIKQNADNAQQASQLASGSREFAEKGGRVVGKAVEAMREINQSSKKIGDIITTIDELAFQTNILALNAAVEAARAGEQGRGFAVVAAEVRNLARRSATAAKEIKTMIEDSVRNVENGADLVNQSGQTLGEIVTAVKRVTDIVAEIAAASREQATGIDQVALAVSQMDQVTQANAAQTEELSSTSESLATQGAQLQAQVARFKLGVVVAAPEPRRATPARRPAATRKPTVVKTAQRAAVAPPVVAAMAPTSKPMASATSQAASDADLDHGFEEF